MYFVLFLVLRVSSAAVESKIFNKTELLKLAVKKKKIKVKKRLCKAVRDLSFPFCEELASFDRVID